MKQILNFFQEVVLSELTNQKPVGLSSFNHIQKTNVASKKSVKKNDVKLSDLMRRY